MTKQKKPGSRKEGGTFCRAMALFFTEVEISATLALEGIPQEDKCWEVTAEKARTFAKLFMDLECLGEFSYKDGKLILPREPTVR